MIPVLVSGLILFMIAVYLKIPRRGPMSEVVRERPEATKVENQIVVVQQPHVDYNLRPPYQRYRPPTFQQTGYLRSDRDRLLPVYGRRTDGHSDRFHYYTVVDDIRVPLRSKDRDAMDTLGVDELYQDDSVTVLDNNLVYNSYQTRFGY